MTREEALTQLRLGPGINEDVSEEYNDAVNMAIKSLEREDILDKIRAEIDNINLNKVALKYENRFYGFQQEIIKIIDKYAAESEDKE